MPGALILCLIFHNSVVVLHMLYEPKNCDHPPVLLMLGETSLPRAGQHYVQPQFKGCT
jgi:hypothetical protein